MMEVTSAPTINSKVPEDEPLPPQQGQVQKKRKFSHHEKVVVTVKVEGMNQKNEGGGPPSDRWSWRKYGQKPIKGSPYPRGYYRCSTSKGCSAKKQVEKCRTDPSVLIITYTANHSHADPPDVLGNTETSYHYRSTPTTTVIGIPSPKQTEVPESETEMEEKKEKRSDNEDEHFRCYLQSPLCGSKENNLLNEEEMETAAYEYDSPENPLTSFLVNGNSKCPSSHKNNNNSNSNPQLMASSLSAAQNSEENNNNDDFYDELEELPTSSFFSSFMRRSFVEERILINPSS